MLKLKYWYLNLLENNNRTLVEKLLHLILLLLSLIYGLISHIRNFFYNRGVMASYKSTKPVISLGNLSWAGSGKTTLAIWLYDKLKQDGNQPIILRRGYGQDEEELIKEKGANVLSNPSRVKLVKDNLDKFTHFILDDGFQHRKLKRNIDVVLMGARELKRPYQLIPASIFREPLNSLNRADILIINYKEDINDQATLEKRLQGRFPHLDIFFAQYRVKKFVDLDGNFIDRTQITGKKLAAFTAIGHPQGFINKIKELDLNLVDEIIYPDHYQLSDEEFLKMEDELINKGIEYLLITYKDKYHIPKIKHRLKIVIIDISIDIDNEEKLYKTIRDKCTI